MAPFINPARDDELILRHWSKKKESSHPTFPATPAESNGAAEVEQEVKAANTEPSYHFAKFNVKLEKPEYTDAQYETHLKSEDWDRSETDYLVELVHEWDLRWVVIADRYEYEPSDRQSQDTNAVAEHTIPKERSMEDLKSRYYQVASKIMALHHPLSKMSAAEFETHQKMTKFDPVSEMKRKKLVHGLLSRTAEEIQEEELLLGELKRITGYSDRFSQERKELYNRLDYPISAPGSSAPLSSDDLNMLWKTLLNADKNRKHRVLSESLANPSSSTSSQPPITQTERNPRSSVSGPADKRQSISGTPTYRQLTPREEAKFGVSHHDRLPGGVHFRHERVVKLSQAKSNAQAAKISAALVELNIPPRLFMPTAKVVSQYERLINSIQILTECKKVTDKVEHEIRVLQMQRDDTERRKQEGTKLGGSLLEPILEVKQVQTTGEDEVKGEDDGAAGTGLEIDDAADEMRDAPPIEPKLEDDEADDQEGKSANDAEANNEEDEEEPDDDDNNNEDNEELVDVEEEEDEDDEGSVEKSDRDRDASEEEEEQDDDGGADNENENESDHDDGDGDGENDGLASIN